MRDDESPMVDREAIGTVQQLYDGALLPDVQVRTLKNLHRLFPTRTVRHAGTPLPIPAARDTLKNAARSPRTAGNSISTTTSR